MYWSLLSHERNREDPERDCETTQVSDQRVETTTPDSGGGYQRMIEKIKTIWIVTVCLTFLAGIAMLTGQEQLAGVAIGALAGWVGGNRNGQRGPA